MGDGRVEKGLDLVIMALCLDYPRRADAILNKSTTHRTDTELRYLNFKIFDAAAEIVGERYAERFILDIGERVGYAKTEMDFFSEVSYKQTKKQIKENIAKKLHLVD